MELLACSEDGCHVCIDKPETLCVIGVQNKLLSMETNNEKTKSAIFKIIYESLSLGTRSSIMGKKWLTERNLTIKGSGAAFNSGQAHHNRSQEFKDELEITGFIKRNGANQCGIGYTSFGKQEMIFPLKNDKNEIVNFFATGIKNEMKAYLNEEGLYPTYPSRETRRLFVTTNLLDAATMLESGMLKSNEAVLALFEGEIKPQHKTAIAELFQLEEVILIDGTFVIQKL